MEFFRGWVFAHISTFKTPLSKKVINNRHFPSQTLCPYVYAGNILVGGSTIKFKELRRFIKNIGARNVKTLLIIKYRNKDENVISYIMY